MKRSAPSHLLVRFVGLALLAAAAFSAGCQPASEAAAPTANLPAGLTPDQIATLESLMQVDEYPLYTMSYQGDYELALSETVQQKLAADPAWACSLFAAYGNPEEVLLGRNFDWDFSPALLLYLDPPTGYASVSMVDIHYLGYGDERAYGLEDLPLEELTGLLNAPLIPFDGINEAGLAVGMAAVPSGKMVPDPARDTVDSVMVIRKILDQAATIDEAVEVIQRFNIDMQGNYLHYLITEASGQSALVEFSEGEMVVRPGQGNWQAATNFLLSEAGPDLRYHCGRYDRIVDRLTDLQGMISPDRAMSLLEDVRQPSTQWSAIYRLSADEVRIVMGGEFTQEHKFKLGFSGDD